MWDVSMMDPEEGKMWKTDLKFSNIFFPIQRFLENTLQHRKDK